MPVYINFVCEKCTHVQNMKFDQQEETWGDMLSFLTHHGWQLETNAGEVKSVACPLHLPRTDVSCPSCGRRHIDEGEFATKVHRTHRCVSDSVDQEGGCGHEWRVEPPIFGVMTGDTINATRASTS